MTLPQHSAATCEHGTPAEGVDLARYSLGGLDLDPFSSAYWNHYSVKAGAFFDKRTNGLAQDWTGKLIVNPPGEDSVVNPATKKREVIAPSLVRPAWEKLVQHWRAGQVDGALWWGYSLEQLQMLQVSPFMYQGAPWSPLKCLTVILAARPKHLVRSAANGPPTPGTSPTHGGYATLLPSVRFRSLAEEQVARFVERAGKLGVVVRPVSGIRT